MKGGGLLAWFTLAATGVIIANILIHPEGVKAFGGTLNDTLGTTFNAMLGKSS